MIHVTTTGTTRNPLNECALLDSWIYTGFGDAIVYRNGEEIYDQHQIDSEGFYAGETDPLWTFNDAESAFIANPGNYTVWMYTPLWSVIYQRKLEGWITVYAGMGFADDENAELDREALSKLLEHDRVQSGFCLYKPLVKGLCGGNDR